MAAKDNDRLDKAIKATSVDSGRAMASSAKGAGDDTRDNELYKLNQVYYRAIPSLSACTKRCLLRSNFQTPGYSNLQQQTLQCVLNTGELFVNGNQSFLMMQFGIPVTPVGGGGATEKNTDIHAFLPQSGILGIIDQVWLMSASGTEIIREQNKGLQIENYLINKLSPQSFNNNGEQEGRSSASASDLYSGFGYCRYDQNSPPATYRGPIRNRCGGYLSGGQNDVVPGGPVTFHRSLVVEGAVDVSASAITQGSRYAQNYPIFAIPMSHLLGIFKPYMNVLLPGILLAGATLSIRIKNLVEPLIITGSAFGTLDTEAKRLQYAQTFANSAVIPQIYINWDAYQFNDAVVKKVNEIAGGEQGLTIMFDTYDWSSTPAPTLSVEAQVAQARSRIKDSWCVVRDQGQVSNPYVPSLCPEAGIRRPIGPSSYEDSMWNTNLPSTVLTYQAILGALYFPQQPLQNPAEMYANQLYIFGKNYRDEDDTSCVSLQDWAGALGPTSFNAGVPVAPIANPWSFPYGRALYGLTAERSSMLNLTGLTISNARLLRHRFTFSNPSTSGQRNIDVFTTFTRVAKVYSMGRVSMRE